MQLRILLRLSCLVAGIASTTPVVADEPTPLTLNDFRGSTGTWFYAKGAMLHPENPRKLLGEGESGPVLVNGKTGRTRDLYTKESYRDVTVKFDFMLSRRSNSGVKFMGLYEIQLFDSAGKAKLTGSDCGGIYPRAKLRPRYQTIDDGFPPKVNAAKPAGEWQTLEATFRAPRFDNDGNKMENARMVKAVLNGQVIHQDVELKHPTGSNWVRKEVPKGPLMFQGDHGPVAFRNIQVQPLP